MIQIEGGLLSRTKINIARNESEIKKQLREKKEGTIGKKYRSWVYNKKQSASPERRGGQSGEGKRGKVVGEIN